MRLRTLALSLLLIVPLAACGDDDNGSSDTVGAGGETTFSSVGTAIGGDETTTSAAATVPAGSDELIVTTTDLGEILAGSGGLTVYAFDQDTATTSACSGGCAGTWPPVEAGITAGEGLDPALLGEITRDDGTTQATYGGHPLYTFAGDTGPGDTNGHGVGGVWHAVAPDGSVLS